MSRLLVVAAALLISACNVQRPPYGGDKENALATATIASDAATVAKLLGSGADPNKRVTFNGHEQSSWFLALHQMRPNRPDTVAIVLAMAKAGASLRTAWGTPATDVTGPRESRWHRFMRSGRGVGAADRSPLDVAMEHPVPEVIRALVGPGFDPRMGESALVSAIESGQIELARILIDAEVDVNCHPGANTPLLAAIEIRNMALMTYLEAHGAREKP